LIYSISKEKFGLILLYLVLWCLQKVAMKNEQTVLSADQQSAGR
jgi:hypothetical protein